MSRVKVDDAPLSYSFMTAYANTGLLIIKRGTLSWPLTKYTTERFLEGDPRLDLITARHVLCHTTGFPNWRSEKEPLAIHFTPGERYQRELLELRKNVSVLLRGRGVLVDRIMPATPGSDRTDHRPGVIECVAEGMKSA